MSLLGGRKVIHAQSREIIYNVYKHTRENNRFMAESGILNFVSAATGVSTSSIERIRDEGERDLEQGERKFSSPHKKRPRKSIVKDMDEHLKYDIRRVVLNFHKTEQCRMTVKQLKLKLEHDFNLNLSKTSLLKVLKELKFRWRKTRNNRKILCEKQSIRILRTRYLQSIVKYREENRPIVYLDETYIHSSHTSSKSWNDDSSEGLFGTISKGQRLIMINAGGDMGFIPNALLMFKSGTKSGDYHDEMNGTNYEKWLKDKLIPNLPPNSVVVIDNAPYHNVKLNPAPTSNSRKQDIITWLEEKGIAHNPAMLKLQLYQLVKDNRDKYIEYKFDKLLTDDGHSVLRLPPYHPDLNPIELVWATIKGNVAKKNTTFKLNDVSRLAEYEFNEFTDEDWRKRCDHILKNESTYIGHELFMETEPINRIAINLGEDGDTSSDSSVDISDYE